MHEVSHLPRKVLRLVETSVEDCRDAMPYFSSAQLSTLRHALVEAQARQHKTRAQILKARIVELAEPRDRRAGDRQCICGHVACICKVIQTHKVKCRYRMAAQLSVELPCTHGFQACPDCDPCTCGANVDLKPLR